MAPGYVAIIATFLVPVRLWANCRPPDRPRALLLAPRTQASADVNNWVGVLKDSPVQLIRGEHPARCTPHGLLPTHPNSPQGVRSAPIPQPGL